MLSPRRRPPDLPLLIAVLVLLVLGIVMVYSSSFIIGHNEYGDGYFFLIRHLTALMLGLLAMGLLAGIDYRRWQAWAPLLLAGAVVLLVLVLIPGIGVEIYGARRWINLGRFLPQLQPSELAKLAVVLFMAAWLSTRSERASRFTSGSLVFVAVVTLAGFLIMRQPDMGTTLVLILAASSLFWVAGANVFHVASLGALGGAALYYLAHSATYRQQRLIGWTDPFADPEGLGWHTVQSLIALGSGGWWGVGLGASIQKAYRLPNAHTDAIYSVIGEELGLLGTTVVVVLFAVIAWRGLVIAHRARDRFGRLLAVGLVALLVWQGLLNMMVSVNAVPFTGVTLPFLSFGGTSLLASLAAVGLLLSISRGAPMAVAAERPRRAPKAEPLDWAGPAGARTAHLKAQRPAPGWPGRAPVRTRSR